MGTHAGLVGTMHELKITNPDGTYSLLIKSIAEPSLQLSKLRLLPREALSVPVVNSLNERAGAAVDMPKVVFSAGDLESGKKVVVMEDLRGQTVQAGMFFQGHSPLHSVEECEAVVASFPELTTKDVCLQMARAAAAIHAQTWRPAGQPDPEVPGAESWLPAVMDRAQEGRGVVLQRMQSHLEDVQRQAAEAEPLVRWDPLVLDCLAAALKAAQEGHTRTSSRALIHGDFHPANMLWRKTTAPGQASLIMLDWEQLHIGNGAREVAQALISHASPALRREVEDAMIDEYHKVLVEAVGEPASEYTREACYEEYVYHGAGWWMTLLLTLSSMCPPPWVQYFHDQVHTFLADHKVTADNAPALE